MNVLVKPSPSQAPPLTTKSPTSNCSVCPTSFPDCDTDALHFAATPSNGGSVTPPNIAGGIYHGYDDSGHSTSHSHSPNEDAAVAASGTAAVLSREAADKLGEISSAVSLSHLARTN